MMHRLKRRLAAAGATLALVVAGVGMFAAPAHASSGRVQCMTTGPVVGMWIDVAGGTDGYATLTSTSNPKIKYWSYNTQGKSWRAFVGCGGYSWSWGSSNESPWTSTTSTDLVCYDFYGYCTI